MSGRIRYTDEFKRESADRVIRSGQLQIGWVSALSLFMTGSSFTETRQVMRISRTRMRSGA